VAGPGTANTRRPYRLANAAVISAPLSSVPSMTSVA
jgi:hypothetical protein